MSRITSARFDFRKSVSYDPEAKRLFHTHTRRQLLALAAGLGLRRGDYDLRSNEGAIAVSGQAKSRCTPIIFMSRSASPPWAPISGSCSAVAATAAIMSAA
jgi:hypothetical protein